METDGDATDLEETPHTFSHATTSDFNNSSITATSTGMFFSSQPTGSTIDEANTDVGISKNSIVPDLPSFSFPFDRTSLHPIDLTQPLPVSHIGTHVGHTHSSTRDEPTDAKMYYNVRKTCESFSRHRLRKARKEIFYKMGLRNHWCDERKLIAAVLSSDASRVVQLLEEGANPNVCDQKMRTPLHIAASQGQDYVVSLLLAKRADPNRQDILGNTPLHLAVCRGDKATVKMLAENGADIFISDNNGRTPLTLVTARLASLRRQRHLTAERLNSEFLLIAGFLKFHVKKTPKPSSVSMDELCNRMQTVSTKEEMDEVADVVFEKMSDMTINNIAKKEKSMPSLQNSSLITHTNISNIK